MTHNNIFIEYQKILPEYALHTTQWWPNGKNSIRVRLRPHENYILTYKTNRDWTFETESAFLNRGR